MVEGILDRFDPQGTRLPAAVEWRTIPPTIKDRKKKRPPPLALHTKRSSDAYTLSPGPPDSSTTASSFTSLATSGESDPRSATLATFQPSSARSEDYATPMYQNSPSAEALPRDIFPDDIITGPNSNVTPAAPPDPYQYLVEHPWSIDEYLRLLAAVSAHTVGGSINWTRVADRYNLNILREPRSVWDCWYRGTVSWVADDGGRVDSDPTSTFKSAPGVQHDYRHADVGFLIAIHDAISIAQPGVIPPLLSPSEHAKSSSSKVRYYSQHPSYPSPTSLPNVPPRSFGDSSARGILPWFSLTAVNMTMLKKVLDDGKATEFLAGVHLPKHLRALNVPPPLIPRGQGSTSSPEMRDVKRSKASQMLERIRAASARRGVPGGDIRL